MTTYAEQLRDQRWKNRRGEIRARDRFTCRLCGDGPNNLEVHHLYYTKGAAPWEYPDDALVTLCEGCHHDLHHVDHGARIIKALIAAGASIYDIHGITAAFERHDHSRLPAETWTVLGHALGGAIDAAFVDSHVEGMRKQIADAASSFPHIRIAE